MVKITEKEKKLIDLAYAGDYTDKEAAIEAGYKPEQAQAIATNVLHSTRAQKYKREKYLKAQKEKGDSIAKPDEVLEFLTAGMRGEREETLLTKTGRAVRVPINEKDRLKNAELFAKITGIVVKRQEISGINPIIISSEPRKADASEGVEISD